MSILDRLQLLIRSEMTPLRRSPSSPDEARAVLRDVRDSLARLYAAERQVSERYQDLLDEAQSWEDRAALAARAGNDGLAREALQRKRAVELNAESTRRELDRVQREIVQLRDGVDRLRASTATAGPAAAAPSSYAPSSYPNSTGASAPYAPSSVASGSPYGGSYASPESPYASPAATTPAEGPSTAQQAPSTADAPGWGAAGGWGVRRAPSPWATSGADSAATPTAGTHPPAGAAAYAPAPRAPTEPAPLAPTPGGYHAGPLPPSGAADSAGPLAPSGAGYLTEAPPSRATAPPTSAERAAATIDRAYDRVDPTLAAMGSRIEAMEADAAAAEIVAADLGDPLADPHAASFARLERDAHARRVDAEVDALRARVANESAGASGDDASEQGGGDDPLERLRRRLGGA